MGTRKVKKFFCKECGKKLTHLDGPMYYCPNAKCGNFLLLAIGKKEKCES